MKKLISFLILIIISNAVFSQNYNPVFKTKSTEWKAYYSSFFGEGMSMYSSTSDTTINSKKYRIIYEGNKLIGYLREDSATKKIYRYTSFFGEHLLYNFNLVKNDTFSIYLMGFNFQWNWIKFSVDTTYNVNTLGGVRKAIQLSSINSSYKFKWIESIGAVHINENNLTYIPILYNNLSSSVDYPGYKLICKMDDNIKIYENIYNRPGRNYSCNGVNDTCLNNINDSIFIVNNTIKTFEKINVKIEWLYCDSNKRYFGDTGLSFTPKIDGNYAAGILKDGCYKISKCIAFKYKSEIISNIKEKLFFYPNPTKDYIQLSNMTSNIEVLNRMGEIVIQQDRTERVDLTNLANGIYFIKLFDEDKRIFHCQKLVIER